MTYQTADRPSYLVPALGSVYTALEVYSWPLVRAATGFFFLPHGMQKLFGFWGGDLAKTAEGFGKLGPTSHANNPGNLTDEGDVGCGCIQTHGRNGAKITIYRTPEDGWAALTRKVTRMLNGSSRVYTLDLSIAQVAQKWCGDPAWGINVAKYLKVTPETTLATLIGNDPKSQDAQWPNG